ncbi:serine hydrolase [Actinoplanes sp. NPDC051633]|uniref:serine hydrolase domain-containing protein n=1 Tax=Actinoplanes sp. NPDC051633 TaxID=3155670 RepID=UPI0034461520
MELIEDFVRAANGRDGVELHGLMVLRHGEVVARRWWEPYGPSKPHLLYSLSKSFTSTALGFAVTEGSVDLDATVLSYFPEHDDRVTDERSRAMKVRHVAAMASGHLDETIERAWEAGDGDLLLGLLLMPPERDPGTVFAYNQPCTYALSAIVQKVSGVPLTEYLRPRLFEPLGITTYGWVRDRKGRDIGFSGLHTTTEAVARLGQLYLREGSWEGKQLLPAAWVAEATRRHVETARENPDWSQGYGFQFWRARHGYRGDGAYGQFMLVLPEQDAVVAITSQSPDMQALLDAAWEHLLPALGADRSSAGTAGADRSSAGVPGADRSSAGVAGAERDSAVAENCHTPALTWSPPSAGVGEAAGAGAPREAVFRPGPGNEWSALRTVTLDGDRLTLTDHGRPLEVELGHDGWTVTGPVATVRTATGVDIVFAETPHRLHLTLDTADHTFAAVWETVPLDPAPPLSSMRMPR